MAVTKLFLRWDNLGAHPQETYVGRTRKGKSGNVGVKGANMEGVRKVNEEYQLGS